MTENCNFQLYIAFSSKILELEVGCCYLRFYTAESKPEGKYLLEISEIFHISYTSFQKLGKINEKLSVWSFF